MFSNGTCNKRTSNIDPALRSWSDWFEVSLRFSLVIGVVNDAIIGSDDVMLLIYTDDDDVWDDEVVLMYDRGTNELNDDDDDIVVIFAGGFFKSLLSNWTSIP